MGYEDAIMFGSSAFLFIIFYLSTKISAKVPIQILNRPTVAVEILQPFFIIFGWVYSLFHLSLMLEIATISEQATLYDILIPAYQGIAWIVLPFFVFYFIVSFVYNLLSSDPIKRFKQ